MKKDQEARGATRNVFSTSASPSTPSTSSATAATINFSREYALAIHTASYNEIWANIHHSSLASSSDDTATTQAAGEVEIINRLLRPNRASIDAALSDAPPTRLSSLVSSYFDSSEQTSLLCLSLFSCIHRARSNYAPITSLLEFLPIIVGRKAETLCTAVDSNPLDSSILTMAQCDWALNIFCEFDSLENPFLSLNSGYSSNYTFQQLQHCFLELKDQLDLHLAKARSRWLFLYRVTWCSSICLVAWTAALTIVALLLTFHAMAGVLAVGPVFVWGCLCLPSNLNIDRLKQQIEQLDAVAKGIYVLNNDVDTIKRLVDRLCSTIESDKKLVRLGLENGRGQRHSVEEIVRHLRKNQCNLLRQLTDLEEHICLYFAAVNRTRAALLYHLTVQSSSL